jgi:predicted  nucleic acid-binding Zn-ribbon protein
MATKPVSKKAPAKKTSAKAVSKAKKEVIEAVDAIEEAVEATSDSIIAKVSKNVSAAQNVAKQIWFANLGVAGRSYEEAVSLVTKANDGIQSRYTKLNKESQDLVTDLVARGEKVQDEAQVRLSEGRATVEEQIEAAKGRLAGLTSGVDIPARLQNLSNKLGSLSKDLKKSA